MKRTFGAICLFLMACLGLQAAQVDTLMVRSESMNKDIKVVAIRPDKTLKGEKCPVVYLLHGYGGHAKTWIEVRPDLPQIADRDENGEKLHHEVSIMSDDIVMLTSLKEVYFDW